MVTEVGKREKDFARSLTAQKVRFWLIYLHGKPGVSIICREGIILFPHL